MSLPIRIVFDGLSGVDGSARFSFGPTTAIASVSGPVAARLAAEHPVRATVDVLLRPLSSVPGTTEKRAAIAIKGIIERACIITHHPRTLIQVVVQALSPSSSPSPRSTGMPPDVEINADLLLAAEINACSLALLSAGSIPMRGVVCAVAVAVTEPQPPVVTGGDISAGSSRTTRNRQHVHVGCFAFLFGVDHTTSVQDTSTGTDSPIPPSKMIWTNYRASPGNAFSVTALAQAEKVALEAAGVVWKEMKESLRTSSFAGGGPS